MRGLCALPTLLVISLQVQAWLAPQQHHVLAGSGRWSLAQQCHHQRSAVPSRQHHQQWRPTARRRPRMMLGAPSRAPTKMLRVVTDIDDTVKSSGNLRLAGVVPLGGIDAQYERGEFYPGVFQFALELSTHGAPRGVLPLPVAVLTARAKEFLFALELDSQHPVSMAYRQCGSDNGFDDWGLGPVLYGSVKEWICWTRKSRRKFKNFRRLMERDTREGAHNGYVVDYVFVGDTGEGDYKAGLKMSETFPHKLRAMFLHMVYCDDPETCIVPDDYVSNGVPVLFFKTYVGAAAKAFEQGLLDRSGVERVIQRAVQDLEESGVPRISSKWFDLEADITMAQATFAARQPPLVPALANLANIFQLQQ